VVDVEPRVVRLGLFLLLTSYLLKLNGPDDIGLLSVTSLFKCNNDMSDSNLMFFFARKFNCRQAG